MLAQYRQLFAELHDANVEHCIWKNIHETPEALAGSGDLDLYISPGSYLQFITVLRQTGFIRLISHKATPCVEHYYGLDAPSGKFCHLHCYFRIVTGESHIKQYVVPIEDHLSDFPNKRNADGISEMHPVLQYKLNLFRRSIKLSCLPGALLFFRERHGYQHERRLLEHALRSLPATESGITEKGWLASIQTSSTVGGEIVAGIRNRFYFRHWNRFPALATVVYRYGTILLRLAGKLRRRRKTLPMGVVIAVTGSTDAVTMLESHVANWLGQHFSVVTVDDSMQFAEPGSRMSDVVKTEVDQGLGWEIRRFWYSLHRRRKIKSTLQQTIEGSIVIWRGLPSPRQSFKSQPSTENSQSTVTKLLTSTSDRLIDAKPQIDILLCLPGESTASVGGEDISTDAETTHQFEHRETKVDPARSPVQISLSNRKLASEAIWKHEVWQALVAFQP